MDITSVLIVDDDEGSLFLAEMMLREVNPDIKIEKAFDGEEALQILDKLDYKPDIILLDINMPGMNGIEFLENYNNRDNKTSVVAMLTSSENENDKNACMKYDFVKAYIIKPIDADDIKNMAESIVI